MKWRKECWLDLGISLNTNSHFGQWVTIQLVHHHFHLTQAGGIIEVGADQSTDTATLTQIRDHLRTISHEFAKGVFTSPVSTHAEVPPGVGVMGERKTRISYTYKETTSGGQVIIATKDKTARTAVHEFLKYQIHEHATGDPLTTVKN